MEFTEKDLLKQEQDFAALKEEFSRLNARFDGMFKEGGFSDGELKKTLEGKLPPEIEKALEQARAEAARAGRARAAQTGAEDQADHAKSAGRGRPGAMKI